MAKEVFTDADNFGVVFPVDLDVKAKATALGAVFLIVSTAHDNNNTSLSIRTNVVMKNAERTLCEKE